MIASRAARADGNKGIVVDANGAAAATSATGTGAHTSGSVFKNIRRSRVMGRNYTELRDAGRTP